MRSAPGDDSPGHDDDTFACLYVLKDAMVGWSGVSKFFPEQWDVMPFQSRGAAVSETLLYHADRQSGQTGSHGAFCPF